jgi:hypothetical protein
VSTYDQTLAGTYVTGPATTVDANGAPVPAGATVSGVVVVVELALDGQTQICDAAPVARPLTLINVGTVPVYVSQAKALTFLPGSPAIPVGLAIHAGESLTMVTSSAIYGALLDDCGLTGLIGLIA